MIRVNYGDVQVNAMGESFDFRPSFRNALKIGTPKQIISTFSTLHCLNIDHDTLIKLPSVYASAYVSTFIKGVLPAAYHVLNCCLDTKTDSNIVGYFSPSKSGTSYRQGAIPIDDMIVLAKHLMKHMIVGKPDDSEKKNGDYLDEFDVSNIVDIAMLKLRLSEDEALNLSMTRFQSMVRIEYPEQRTDVPTDKEYDDCMDFAEKVNAARASMH